MRKATKTATIMSAALLLVTTTWLGCSPASGPSAERGRYLVTIMACADCHTPWRLGPGGPEPDPDRHLSGHPETMALTPAPQLPPGPWSFTGTGTMTAWSGPWGTSFPANLTPDPETGLGKWTFEMFRDTIRTGRHWGTGREVLPPMPIPAYKHANDADLADIFAYLQSIPPIRNRVPDPIPPAAR